MSFAFLKSYRLRHRGQYQRVAQMPTRLVGHHIIIEYRQSRYPQSRLGVTVSRHHGNAVRRNRFKRIVKEAYRLSRHLLKDGIDIIVKPRQLAHVAKMQDISQELILFLASTPHV